LKIKNIYILSPFKIINKFTFFLNNYVFIYQKKITNYIRQTNPINNGKVYLKISDCPSKSDVKKLYNVPAACMPYESMTEAD